MVFTQTVIIDIERKHFCKMLLNPFIKTNVHKQFPIADIKLKYSFMFFWVGHTVFMHRLCGCHLFEYMFLFYYSV